MKDPPPASSQDVVVGGAHLLGSVLVEEAADASPEPKNSDAPHMRVANPRSTVVKAPRDPSPPFRSAELLHVAGFVSLGAGARERAG